MSQIDEKSIKNPLKACKILVLRPKDLSSPFIKVPLIISTIVSISFFLYLSFSDLNSGYYKEFRSFNHRKIDTATNTNNNTNIVDYGTNISHVVFGIGGSVKTWTERRHYSDLWWNHNATRGFVWLDENPGFDWPETSPPYKISADTSMFNYTCWYGFRSAIRVARIVKETFELGLDNVRWFVMGDDDTIFFTENLVGVLAKYDHNQMYYIGGNSESVEQDVIHSYAMAYGGAGFAVSYPLAAALVRILDGCINRYADFYGSDQKVQGCLSEIGVPVTKELGFHQVDIRGNPYGLLAAHPLAPLVSFHHLDYVQSLFPSMTQIESLKKLHNAYKMDPSRTLQHTFCYDTSRNWSVSVSWGYTVQLYPWLATAKELETAFLTFQSWRTSSTEPFTFDTRIVSSDSCKRPILYFLDRVEKVVGIDGGGENGNGTVTSYKRFVEAEKECGREDYVPALGVKYINVSASEFNPSLWRQAPRRQCCDVLHDENMMNGGMEVRIRGCNELESVTPP